jgi:signal transduction histidine kinase
MAKPGRNDPCPCGSGNKYKKCCLAKEEAVERQQLAKADAKRAERAAAGSFSTMRRLALGTGVAHDGIAELAVNAKGRRVAFRTSIDTDRVYVDEDLFRRTLANLVENAIRYAPPESTVTLTAARLDSGTEIRVADAGSGIPLEMRDKVFDPFVQVEAGAHPIARAGRGLGLTFCKLVALAHGGRIWVEDAAPGAIFCIRLPNGP